MALSFFLMVGGGCATLTTDAPLHAAALNDAGAPPPESGSHLAALPQKETGSDLMDPAGFSSGSMRSAAFACDALNDLQEFSLPGDGADETLLGAGDIISVSAQPAAPYGFHRDHIFTDFDKDFLSRRINNHNWGGFLPPRKFRWLAGEKFGASDRIAGVYGRLMFHGATHADLQKQGRPLISIDTTDVDRRGAFAFMQDPPELSCSGLSTFPLVDVSLQFSDADTTRHVHLMDSSAQIDSDNFKTMTPAGRQQEGLRETVTRLRCGRRVTDNRSCGDVQATIVHSSLADASDPQALGTGPGKSDRSASRSGSYHRADRRRPATKA